MVNKLNAKVSHDPESGKWVASYVECGSSHVCYGETEQEAIETLEDCVEVESGSHSTRARFIKRCCRALRVFEK